MDLSEKEWRDLRDRICRRAQHTCAFCGETAHQVAHRTKGSTRLADNEDQLVCACTPCKKATGTQTFASFTKKRDHAILNRARFVPRKPRHHFRVGNDYPVAREKPLTGLKLRLAQRHHPDRYPKDS